MLAVHAAKCQELGGRTEADHSDREGAETNLNPHPVSTLRPALEARGVTPAAKLLDKPNGAKVRTAGSVIVRQRPGTAKGLLFLTLEDETGMSQAIVSPDLLQEHRKRIVGSPGLVVEGMLQKRDGSHSVKAEKFWSISGLVATSSHDFR